MRQLDYLRQQSEQFKSFTTTFAQETAQKTALAINSVVKLHAEKIYARIDPAIELFGESIGKAADQAMTQLVRDFSAALRFEGNQDMEKLVAALVEAQQALDAAAKHVRESGESMALMIAHVMAEQKASVNALLAQACKLFDEGVTKNAESFVNAADALTNASQDIGTSLQKSVTLFEERLSAALQQCEEGIAASTKIYADHMECVQKGLEQAKDSMAETIEKASSACTHVSETAEQAMRTMLADLPARLDDVSESMRSDVHNLLDTVKTVRETYASTVNQSFASLQDALSQMTETWKTHADRLAHSTDVAAEHFEETLSTTTGQLQRVDAYMRSNFERSQAVIAEQVQTMANGMKESVAASTKLLETSLQETTRVMRDNLFASAERTEEAMTKLVGTLETLNQSASATAKVLRRDAGTKVLRS